MSNIILFFLLRSLPRIEWFKIEMSENKKLSTMVNSLDLKNYFLSQESMLNDAEIGWAGDIIRNLNFSEEKTDTLIYFQFLRNKKLKNHRKSRFAMKCFCDNGTCY